MLIPIWPDANSSGYILANRIVGVLETMEKGSHAVKVYNVLIDSGNMLRVTRDAYEEAEKYLITVSDFKDFKIKLDEEELPQNLKENDKR